MMVLVVLTSKFTIRVFPAVVTSLTVAARPPAVAFHAKANGLGVVPPP